MKNVRSYASNEVGRDFVIGDLHGALDRFAQLFVHLNFDPEVDRMFSVGDLVDRGPDSLECLKLLREPWFHAVKANHEWMMIDAMNDGPLAGMWFINGGDWALDIFQSSALEAELRELTKVAEALPYLITVAVGDKNYHIIHAELPFFQFGQITDEDLIEGPKFDNIVKVNSRRDFGSQLLWGREVFGDFYAADLSDYAKIQRTVKYHHSGGFYNDRLSHIISGHTVLQRPLTIYGQTCIDTCAYASMRPDPKGWAGLTCLELKTWTFYQATSKGVRTIEPVVVNTPLTTKGQP